MDVDAQAAADDGAVSRFHALLEQWAEELCTDERWATGAPRLLPTPNEIDPGDVELLLAAVDAEIVTVYHGGRFDTLDRPKPGRWGLLSRAVDGASFNAEYLPQIAAYADAILNLGYPPERVLFELLPAALQLHLAILDDDGRVVVLGEAKRDRRMLPKLVGEVERRFGDRAPGDETKKPGDEARQLAWRLWTVRPELTWLIAPGDRQAYRCLFGPLTLTPTGSLPAAPELGLDHRPPHSLPPPDLR